jgi:predicted transcriptional regulator of viral defense system
MAKVSENLLVTRWQRFLRLLQERVVQPSESHPTARCWKASDLISLISALVDEHRRELLHTFPTAHEAVKRLASMGWLRHVEVESKKKLQFYVMEMDSAGASLVDPLELLQAYLPEGVICYFGALHFHGLTTQIPSFFHIGRIRKSAPPHFDATPMTVVSVKPELKRNPIGTELFRFDDTVCYETSRYAVYTPGTQMRVVAPRTWLRTTTLEQTLLDSLLQPRRCGGESVAFEAWERGLQSYDPDRLTGYLASINEDDLWRRVGAMLEIMETEVAGTPLEPGLAEVKAKMNSQSKEIPILQGLQFSNLNTNWRVFVP